jgi:hypothetical protein
MKINNKFQIQKLADPNPVQLKNAVKKRMKTIRMKKDKVTLASIKFKD